MAVLSLKFIVTPVGSPITSSCKFSSQEELTAKVISLIALVSVTVWDCPPPMFCPEIVHAVIAEPTILIWPLTEVAILGAVTTIV